VGTDRGGRWSGAWAMLRDPGIGGPLAFGLFCSVVQLCGVGDGTFRLRFVWGVQLPFDVLFGWFCWRASRVPGVERLVRQYMRTTAFTALAFLIGDAIQFVRAVVEPSVTELDGGLMQTGFYLVGCAMLVGRMLGHPAPGGTRGARMRFHLDAIAVLVSGVVLAWCLGIDPTDAGIQGIGTVIAVSTVLVAAFSAVKLVLSGNAPVTRGASMPMVLAAVLLGVSLILAPTVTDPDLQTVLLVLRILAPAVLVIGPRIQELQTRVNPVFQRQRPHRPYHIMPYVAVAVTFVVFLAVLPRDLGVRAWGAVIGVVVITAVVAIRQLLAFVDNFDLINRLDATLVDLRGHQALLHEQANRDDLTKLVNRAAFGEAVEAALADPARAGRGLAVLLIDLDDFKTVNDTLGHAVGDSLLGAVARRLREAVRGEDVVARLGGDEFAVLLRDVTAGEAGEMAERILADVIEPARVDGHTLVVRASIGVAPSAPGDDPGSLMRNADIAMYAAKDAGKSGFRRYTPDMGARILQTAELGARLRDAVGTDEFHLVYQPVVDLATGDVVGAEALVRWQPPGREMIFPADFIPTAESTGEIVPLGRWILREACRQLAEWRRLFPAADDLTMAVNVAGRQLQASGFVEEVAAVLGEYGVPADRLVIEVTETAVLDDPVVLAALQGLRGLGLDLALDDFGTAASSLGLLLTCPMTGLKLDRSFVDRLGADSRPTAVATAVSEMARALNLGTVAEGVESPEQAHRLHALGYRRAQGFLWSRPVRPAEFETTWHAVGVA
jgi:diguanylate cyclase (GGDEF)-like protein